MSAVTEPASVVRCDTDDLRAAVDAQAREIAILRQSLAIAESRRTEAQKAVAMKAASLAAFLAQIASDGAEAAGKPPVLLTSSEFEALLRDRNRLTALCRSRWRRLGEKLGIAPRRFWEHELLAEPSSDDLRRRVTVRTEDIEVARRALTTPPSGNPHPEKPQADPVPEALRRFHAECRDRGVDVVVDLGGDGDDGRFVPALRADGYSGEAMSFPPRSAGRDALAAADDPLWRVADGGSQPPGEFLRSLYPDPSMAFGVRIGAADRGAVPLLADVLERTEVILATLSFGPDAALPAGAAGGFLHARGFPCVALFPASAPSATRESLRVDGLFVRGTPA